MPPLSGLSILFGVLVLASVVAVVRRFLRVAAVGAAYKTKALCSALFVSGLRIDDPDRAPEVSAEAYRLMSLFPARVDLEKKTVTASFRGWSERTSVWRPGLGATIAFRPVPPAPALPQPRRLEAAEPWPEGEAPAPAPSAALGRVLDAAFAEKKGSSPRRTRAIVVVRDGRVVAERYAPGVTAATPLNGWSMTKSVFGALVGTLVGDKLLALSDTALLPEWSSRGDARAEIKLEDLLRMRSGLAFTEIYSNPLSDVTRMLFDGPDAAGFAASRLLADQPGTKWKYASGTTNILSLIARRKLGEDAYPSWPRRALFDPLGMASAVFEQDASGTFIGSSFLFATARDWARFGLLHAQDGVWDGKRLLPAGWVKFMTTPTPQSTDLRYGAHWWLKLSKELGGEGRAAAALPPDAFHALGHEGQCVTVIPSRGLVAVRLGLSIDITAWDQAAFLSDLLGAL